MSKTWNTCLCNTICTIFFFSTLLNSTKGIPSSVSQPSESCEGESSASVTWGKLSTNVKYIFYLDIVIRYVSRGGMTHVDLLKVLSGSLILGAFHSSIWANFRSLACTFCGSTYLIPNNKWYWCHLPYYSVIRPLTHVPYNIQAPLCQVLLPSYSDSPFYFFSSGPTQSFS